MKKFCTRFLIFFFPVLLLGILESFLPPTFFTWRQWEGLAFSSRTPHVAPFYPNTQSSMMSQGDLCHHTPHAIFKPETWTVDKLGFRNATFEEQADILFIGDSQIAGSSLEQQNILSEKVKAAFGGKAHTYNMAPCSFAQLELYLLRGQIKKPRLIIFSNTEAMTPPLFKPLNRLSTKNKMQGLLETGNLNTRIDRFIRFYSVQWLRARLLSTVHGAPSPVNPDLFFYNSYRDVNKDPRPTIASILSYKKYCDEQGIDFIYMPVPSKHTVYYEMAALPSQPDYVYRVVDSLENRGVKCINTQEVFNRSRKEGIGWLFHLDDMHLNATGTQVLTNEIVQLDDPVMADLRSRK